MNIFQLLIDQLSSLSCLQKHLNAIAILKKWNPPNSRKQLQEAGTSVELLNESTTNPEKNNDKYA